MEVTAASCPMVLAGLHLPDSPADVSRETSALRALDQGIDRDAPPVTPIDVEPVRDLVTTVWTATASKVSRGSLISQQRRLPACATSEERQ